MKYGTDYTVCKVPAPDEYTDNYEVHGQGRFNAFWTSFHAEDRADAMRQARKIVAEWGEQS